jgi:Fe-Mn family superoxide dismutase
MTQTTTHTARNFDHLIGKIPGLSEKQLRAHFGLYQGYVKKLNEIEEKLKSADPSTANYSYSDYSELQRRRAVPFNGAYLHQLYFENLTAESPQPSEHLRKALEASFGSLENWMTHAKAGLMSGHGWVLLSRSKMDGVLRNNFVEEHHRGVMIESDILLSLDGWEHAYMIDYGTTKAEYIKVLMAAIDWNVVSQRFEMLDKRLHAAA